MKKFIIFSLIAVMVAGSSVFAVDLGGTVFGWVNIVEGTNVEDSDIMASGALRRLRIDGSGENDDGTFGGYFRADGAWGGWSADGNAWWKPIDQLLVRIGGNGGDGFWGKDGVTRWGFYRVAGDMGIAKESWAFGSSFYGGFAGYGGNGLMLEITPMDMLSINIGVPFWRWGKAGLDVYRYTNAQVALNLDFGTIAISFAGNRAKLQPNNGPDVADYDMTDPDEAQAYIDDMADYTKNSLTNPASLVDAGAAKAWLYFGLTAIENLAIDVGVGFPFPVKDDDLKVTCQEPIGAGLGVTFTADAFSVRARVQGVFAGSIKPDSGDAIKLPFGLNFDVLPGYAMNDTMRIYLSAGLALSMPTDNNAKDAYKALTGDDLKATVGFHVNPWIEVGQDWGPRFYAGFDLRADGSEWKKDKKLITWAVPIGIGLSF